MADRFDFLEREESNNDEEEKEADKRWMYYNFGELWNKTWWKLVMLSQGWKEDLIQWKLRE